MEFSVYREGLSLQMQSLLIVHPQHYWRVMRQSPPTIQTQHSRVTTPRKGSVLLELRSTSHSEVPPTKKEKATDFLSRLRFRRGSSLCIEKWNVLHCDVNTVHHVHLRYRKGSVGGSVVSIQNINQIRLFKTSFHSYVNI